MAANREQIEAAAANEVCLRDEGSGRGRGVRTWRKRETTVALKEEVAEWRTRVRRKPRWGEAEEVTDAAEWGEKTRE